eukprot:scaffold1794_cov390-Prasinococcus_capsulatus_cf.AAC.2
MISAGSTKPGSNSSCPSLPAGKQCMSALVRRTQPLPIPEAHSSGAHRTACFHKQPAGSERACSREVSFRGVVALC